MKTQLSEERISMRTNLDTKRFLEAAATMSGYNNLSSFILTTAYKEAQRIIQDAQGRVLSDRDRDLVLNLLRSPPEPNAKLKKVLLNAAAKGQSLEQKNEE